MGITQGLCGYGSWLYAAWKGEVGDHRLFFSSFDGTQWRSYDGAIPGNSSVGPGLTATSNGTLYAAWKGEGLDTRLFCASFNIAAQTWTSLGQIPHVSSCVGPALAAIADTVYAGWTGVDNDLSLHFAAFNPATSEWTALPGIAHAASSIGPSLAAVGSTLYAAWMDGGSIYYASYSPSAGTWSHQTQIKNVATSIGPSLGVAGSTLYAIWKGEEADQELYWAEYDTANATTFGGQTKISDGGSSIGPALATVGNTIYALFVGRRGDQGLYTITLPRGGSWTDQTSVPGGYSGQDFAPPAIGGLGGSSNYVLFSDCNNLQTMGVTIAITDDIVIKGGSGFSFQLNCYSRVDEVCNWQQFILNVNVDDPAIRWQVDNWPQSGGKNLINSGINTFYTPTSGKITTGWGFFIGFDTDEQGNVATADFSCSLPSGELITTTVTLTDLFLINPVTGNNTTTHVSEVDLAPLVAIELDIVGPDGSSVQFTRGAGTITYSTSLEAPPQPLLALNHVPPCAEYFGGTAETSNSFYGLLAAGQSTTITQPFGVNPGAEPTIVKRRAASRWTPAN